VSSPRSVRERERERKERPFVRSEIPIEVQSPLYEDILQVFKWRASSRSPINEYLVVAGDRIVLHFLPRDFLLFQTREPCKNIDINPVLSFDNIRDIPRDVIRMSL